MTTQTPLFLRPDGSIDTARYMARGRLMRSQTAHKMAKDIIPDKPRFFARLFHLRPSVA